MQVVLVRWNEPFQKLATCDMEGGIFVWIQYEGRWSVELVNDRGAQVLFYITILLFLSLNTMITWQWQLYIIENIAKLKKELFYVWLSGTFTGLECINAFLVCLLGKWLYLVPWWNSGPDCLQRWLCLGGLSQWPEALVIWDQPWESNHLWNMDPWWPTGNPL